MKVKVLKKEESKFFPRVEAVFEIEYAGKTPSRQEISSEIAKTLGQDEKLVIIKKIKSKYGEQVCVVEANIYLDEKAMKDIENEYILKRNNKLSEEKPEEKKEEKGE